MHLCEARWTKLAFNLKPLALRSLRFVDSREVVGGFLSLVKVCYCRSEKAMHEKLLCNGEDEGEGLSEAEVVVCSYSRA